MRKLVVGQAAREGMTKEYVRPKSPKGQPQQEKGDQVQRLLLTWLVEVPQLYHKIKVYISPQDFTNSLYRQVAEMLFEDIEKGNVNPAAIISRFEEEEEQRDIARLFHTKLDFLDEESEDGNGMEEKAEREKAFHDILVKVKKNAYEADVRASGTDLAAMQRMVDGKVALAQLEKTHISID